MIENLMDRMDFQDQVSWSFENPSMMEILSPQNRLSGPGVWTGPAKGCGSFTMEARKRLDQLKSGCGSSHTTAVDGNQRETPETVLDLVELLEVFDDEEEEDEGGWLYVSTKARDHVDNESALRWCRQVLDNPGPETEARHLLSNKINPRSNFSTRTFSCRSSSLDVSPRIPACRSTFSHRLQNMTELHIMARLQEASLRQEFNSTPTHVSSRRTSSGPEKNQLSQILSSSAQHSPRLTRLHQQVTQFKLLKLARTQTRGVDSSANLLPSSDRTGSPLRTSLRSLQAVRNSRSLDTEEDLLVDITSLADSGESPGTSPVNFNAPSVTDSTLQSPAVRRLLRSQSLSPARVPTSPRGHLSTRGRLLASTGPAACRQQLTARR